MITFYSRPENAFSDLYVAVRRKENRILTDAQLAGLPDIEHTYPYFEEWQMRKKSARRFADYLELKPKPLKILDIGCGNSWFSNYISGIDGTEVLAIDVNVPELEQADRVFSKPNLHFAYADLFADEPKEQFDVAVFNSCFQYFENAANTLLAVRKWLAEGGEIHIIDSPFYRPGNVAQAKNRTIEYYTRLGFPDMAAHYFHHTFKSLGKYRILYRPGIFRKFLNRSPFCWIVIDL